MEFNLNASETGARLRSSTGRGTLSIGDHSVTIMINGKPADLQKLARSISVQVFSTVSQVEFKAADLKIADGVYARDTGTRVEVDLRSSGAHALISGTLAEMREAVRHLAAAVGMVAISPQPGDQISGQVTRVVGGDQVSGIYSGAGWPRSLASLTGHHGREHTIRVETIELHGRTAKEPGA